MAPSHYEKDHTRAPRMTPQQLVADDEIDRLAEDLVLHEGNGKISRPIKPIRLINQNIPMGQRGGSGILNGVHRPRQGQTLLKQQEDSRRSAHQHGQDQAKRVEGSATHNDSSSPTSKTRRKSDEIFDRVRRGSYLTSPDGVGVGDSRGGHMGNDESDLDDTDCEDEPQRNSRRIFRANDRNRDHNHNSPGMAMQLTSEDIEICKRLDDEYERALEEREIGYNARYASVRQSALVSVLFLLTYMSQGTLVYMHQTDWSIPDSLFFSIFTITTVGYGKADLPETPAFQAYTICYIMVGIAALTIMVSSEGKLHECCPSRTFGLLLQSYSFSLQQFLILNKK
jgi:hypothetical protein